MQVAMSAVVDVATSERLRTAKLVDGARQFEGMLLGEMLKGMKFGEAPGDAGEDDGGGGADGTLRGYGTDSLAKAIAAGGGFGIARQIVKQVGMESARAELKKGAKVR
jgi:flagellar protein FlgJ